MALRNQPYFPLYVQDFLSDERLSECSAESTGVYIRLMCLMHKSETYGSILLKQKDKQNENKIKNFAEKLVRQMPYSADVIERALLELIEENVIRIEGDVLYQKRMVNDGKLSETRASARRGKKSSSSQSDKKQNLDADFVPTKSATSSENEIEIENEYEDITENGDTGEAGETVETTPAHEPAVISVLLNDKTEYPFYQSDIDEWQELYPAVDVLAELRKMKGWCKDNPKRRKTRGGIRRFANGWLAKQQDEGGNLRNVPAQAPYRRSTSETAMDALQELHQRYDERGGFG